MKFNINIKTKTKLITVLQSILELKHKDFEALIHHVYGGNFDFITYLAGCEPNTKYYETGLITKKELDKYDQENLNAYLEGGSYNYLIISFLQDLINRDYLPEGDYIIK